MSGFSLVTLPEVFVSDTTISGAVSRALSQNARPAPLIRMLDYAQRYTHAIDWRRLDRARAMLERTGAFAAGEDARLLMPAAAKRRPVRA